MFGSCSVKYDTGCKTKPAKNLDHETALTLFTADQLIRDVPDVTNQ